VAALVARRDQLVRAADLDPRAAQIAIQPADESAAESADVAADLSADVAAGAVLLVVTARTPLRSVRDALRAWEAAADVVLAVFPADRVPVPELAAVAAP
jgi:hypothetical protein